MPPKEREDDWKPLVEATPLMGGESVDFLPGQTMWANDLYVVIKAPMPVDGASPEGPPSWHLSIRRQDRGTARDWRHFQRIKNQLCGPEYEGMEIYPAESRLVDTSNQYHLWCVPFVIPVGFPGRLVMSDPSDAEGAVQRPFSAVDLAYGGVTKPEQYRTMLTDAAKAGVRGARRVEREARRREGH